MEFVYRGIGNFIGGLGRRLIDNLIYSFDVISMSYLSFRAAIFDQAQGVRSTFSVVSMQVYFTGWQALPLITILSLSTGSVVVMQSSMQLSFLGGGDMIGTLLVAIVVREIGPLLTALIVVARSGTAVASELGTMKVNNEIEALESMGIHPLSYIVFPRILGGVLSVVSLSLYFIFVALLGGFVVAQISQDISFNFYLNSIAQAFEMSDFYLFMIKNIFSGTIIFSICSYQGLSVKKSPNEVPQVTTKAVVKSIVYVIGFNLVVTAIFYLSQKWGF